MGSPAFMCWVLLQVTQYTHVSYGERMTGIPIFCTRLRPSLWTVEVVI